jgi:hypothetical protein
MPSGVEEAAAGKTEILDSVTPHSVVAPEEANRSKDAGSATGSPVANEL